MEELKIIMEAVEGLGVMGAWMFGAYLLKQILLVSIVCLTVFVVGKALIRAVLSANDNAIRLKDLHALFGFGYSGNVTGYDVSRMKAEILKFKEKESH